MANIRLKELIEANVDPKLVARSKESGKLVYFKTPQAKDAALKKGSHEDPKAKKGEQPKVDAKPNDMFGGDYANDRGGETPKADTPSKYDNKSYWKINKDDYETGAPSWSESNPEFTAASLDLVNTAINDEFGKDFEITRQYGGGEGGYEGPMQIFGKGKGEDGYSISIGSSGQDGKFGIVFLEPGGEEALFEPNWEPITGEENLTAQQAYKVSKTLLKMPEVQKLLKGEMKPKQFGPTYAKIKDMFSKGKTESTKLTSMIKK